MSLSLIGIIFVQTYYINNSLENKEEQFDFNVKKALSYVSNSIEKQERKEHNIKIQRLINQQGANVDTTAIINFYLKQEETEY